MNKINNSYDLFFKKENLDFTKTEKIVNESLRKADDGELFLEFKQSENFIFDDKKIKNASTSIDKGFGLRSVKDETSAYSHSSDISEKSILNAGKTVKSILSSSSKSKIIDPIRTNKNHYTNIITNGTLLNDDFFNLFLEYKNFKILSVSIDTLGNTNRDFKKGQWEKLVKNLQKFKKQIQQQKSEIVINIKTVVTDENIDQLYNLNKFVSEEIVADTHDLMLLKGADLQHSDVMFKYEDAHKKYKAYKYENFDKLIDQLNLIRKNNIAKNKKAFCVYTGTTLLNA